MDITLHHIHGDEICPIYNDVVLPNEDGGCSLCDSGMDDTIAAIIGKRGKEANRLISELMDLCKVHPDYHGNGTIDEAWQYLERDARGGLVYEA